MAVDVLLVYLPVQYGGGKTYGLPPLGVYQLAAECRDAGLSVRVLDASIKGLTLEQTVAAVRAHSPGLVAMSLLTPHVHAADKAVRALRADGYAGGIILGGPHFNNTKGEYFTVYDADYAMYGECDKSLVTFAKRFLAGEKDFRDVPNLIHRLDGKIVVNQPAPTIGELDALPFPDLGDGDPADYEMAYGRYDRAHSIMTSRGCPYLCTFCDVFSVWGRKVRQRSPKSVVDEIVFNRDKHNIREFFFKDSTFTLNYKWMAAFLEEMKQRKPGVIWHCNTRVDRINPEMMKAMKAVGCRGIFFGVESGNQDVIDKMKKKIHVEDVVRVFREVDSAGIQANAFFMVGNIGENEQTAKDSYDLAMKIPATLMSVAPAVAYPGTEIYTSGLTNKLLPDPQWYLRQTDMGEQFMSDQGGVSPGQFNLPGLSPERQIEICKKMTRDFFLRPSTLWRIFGRYSSARLFWRGLKMAPMFLKYTLSSARPKPKRRVRRWTTGEHTIAQH